MVASGTVVGTGSVTVVVVNWNRRALLEACLQSLERRPQCVEFEVIIVDNGSADGSADWVVSCSERASFPLRLIRNSENRGFCAANNQGIAAARGEFIALLNNDAEVEAGWLAALRSAFEIAPDVGMAASKILVYEDPRIIDKVGHLIYPDGQNRGRGSGEIDRGQYEEIEETLWPDGCAAMYRKTMLDQIGGFDEDFFAYADDAELGLRARIAGWRCFYMPQAVVRHHRGATLGKQATRRLRLIERNRVLLAAKLFPGSLLWKNPAYYLARLTAGLWAALRGQGEAGQFPTAMEKLRLASALLMADLEALAMIPRIWPKRRLLNRIRKLSPYQVEQLLLSHRISLKELSRQVARPS
jgi:GT2 family glycosyltransferase